MPVYKEEDLAKVPNVDFSKANAKTTDIELYFYKDLNQSEEIQITNETVHLLNKSLPTKIISHGYTTNRSSKWYPVIKAAYFNKEPHNIILVDWSKAGNLSYGESSANVEPIGNVLAEFLLKTEIDSKNIHLIGYSLGAHMVGFAGKAFLKKSGKKIGRITGLDPAGPAFENAKADFRLSTNDAEFVDVVHTDMGYYGIINAIGHVDFYVNGGKKQPGRPPLEVDDNYSHRRAVEVFIESVTNDTATAKPGEFINGLVEAKEEEKKVIFGNAVPATAHGIYLLETSATVPYLYNC